MELIKLCILGLPGSGKSAMARFIQSYVSDYQWKVYRRNDYAILDNMYHQDTTGRFQPAEPDGFDILDFKVFDETLQTLEQEIDNDVELLEHDGKKLVIIEFSRNNYANAFQQFKSLFLTDVYFLYLHADVEVCKQRVRERFANPQFVEDDFNVSNYIFENYYYGDDGEDIEKILAGHGVDRTHVKVMKNHHSYEEACKQVEPFIKGIILNSNFQTVEQEFVTAHA